MKDIIPSIITLVGILNRRERLAVFILGFLTLIISGLEIAQIGLLYPIIAAMTGSSVLNDIPVIGPLVGNVNAGGRGGVLIVLLVAMIAVSIVKLGTNILSIYLQSALLSRGAMRLAREFYRIYLYAPIEAHVQRDSAEMVRNIRAIGPNIFSLSIPGVVGIIQGIVSFLLISGLVLFLNPIVVLFATGFIALLVILQQTISGRIFRRLGQERLDLTRRVNALIYLSFYAIKETQLFHLQEFFARRFNTFSSAELENTRQFQFHGQVPSVLNDGILTIGVTLVFAVSIMTMDAHAVLPLLAVLFGAAYRYLPAANRIAAGLNNVKMGSSSVDTYLREKAALASHVPPAISRPAAPMAFERAIEFEKISYRHPNASNPSVAELSFSIRKGEMIGIVGASGAGKTTLANLLLGLYPPQSGRILVDGLDVAANLQGWQMCLGYVPQQVVIADDSVRRNVAFGADDADIDDEKVISALTDVRLADRIFREPGGLDARLGERGTMLSGGEIQRVGIARALYRGARVLVLDEATSALDSATETAITELIKALSQNVTIIVIAHRLSTLRNVDRLLFLKGGRLIEQGTFTQISDSNVEFKELLRSAEFVVEAG